MNARMKNPALILPDAMQAALPLATAAKKDGVPPAHVDVITLHVSSRARCERRAQSAAAGMDLT